MIRKALIILLKREGWMVPFIVLLVAVLEYWREGQITVGGLFAAALVSALPLLVLKLPREVRKLEMMRKQP